MTELKALSRRWIEEGYGRNDASVFEELMPRQMLEESSWREQVAAFHLAFPDLTATVDEQLGEGNRVMTRLTLRGMHTGDLLGLPPTGKPMELSVVEVHEWREGQIADLWNSFHPVVVLAHWEWWGRPGSRWLPALVSDRSTPTGGHVTNRTPIPSLE